MNKPKSVLKNLYLLCLSALTAAADSFYHGASSGMAGVLSKTAFYYLLFFVFFLLMEKAVDSTLQQRDFQNWQKYFRYSKKNIMRLTLLLFIVYFIYLMVFYPGATSYDTVYQIEDLVTGTNPMPYPVDFGHTEIDALMNDHHPVTTTLIFTFFYKLGLMVGDANRGLFLYNLLQCAGAAFLFATVVCYMDRLQVPKMVALISTIFYVSPLFASFVITMTKDALFSLCFVLYYHVFVWLVLSRNFESIKKQWFELILLSLLISLMNKKGMYLAMISNICLIFVLPRRNMIMTLLSALLPFLIVSILMPQVLFPAVNVYPGGKQESLGFAFQQTALSIIEHPESYTEEEISVFFSLLDLPPEELVETYNPMCTDSIKNHFLQDTNRNEIQTYLKLWLSHFFQTPGTYFKATLSICGGYLAPFKAFNVYHDVVYSDAIHAFAQPDSTISLRRNLAGLFYWIQSIPVFSIFCQDSLYMFWFPSFGIYLFVKRREWKRLVLIAPFVANFLFLVVGPICWTRYGLCQLYTFPMLLAVMFQPTGAVQKESLI